MAVNRQPAVALRIRPGCVKVAGGQRQLLHQGGVGHGEDQQLINIEARRSRHISPESLTDELRGYCFLGRKTIL
jgi:hypothetical protein